MTIPIPKLIPADEEVPEGWSVIQTKDDGTRVCIDSRLPQPKV